MDRKQRMRDKSERKERKRGKREKKHKESERELERDPGERNKRTAAKKIQEK